ncbi:MAG: gliding motility-associated C-terminal domain-containing protein [Crocinitomicaceae bacterium]
MKRFDFSIKATGVFTLLISLLYTSYSSAQCSFTGLDPTYCIDDAPVTLVGTPGGGTFSGPGMTGDEFDPAAAGVGVHTITYDIPGSGGDRYYIKSSIGNPWGSTTNNTHMNTAFGADWTLESFEFCDVATVFSPATGFVFLDGSDNQANELNTFLTANLPAIEAWVTAGGVILINSAPNEGSDINFGFGGTTLNYVSFENTVTGVDAAHPVFLGPNLPTTTAMSGTYYSHARILGAGYTNILINAGDVVLCEKAWGAGHVCVGGMTTTNWHNPDPHADNFRANLFVYLDGLATADPCTYTQDVEVFDLPAVTATADPVEVCEGEEVALTGGGADTYVWDGGATDGVAFTPPLGTTTYTVTGTNTTTTCVNTATVDVTVNPNPVVTATASDTEICLGESITFTGGGADTYVWDGGVTDGVPFTPAAAGTYTFTVTGTNTATGCQETASVDITVNDNPTVTATATPDEICLGESITFTGGGADTYVWDGGVTDGVPFTPATAGTFTFNVTGTIGAFGCENTASVDITVHDLPVVTATVDDDIICEGESVIFSGGGADTYTWDGGVTDGIAFTPVGIGTTTYTVTGTDASTGCENTASVELTVAGAPTVTGSASEMEICLGESVVFTGSGAETYTWDGGVTDGVPFTPTDLGEFTFEVTGANAEGCTDTDEVTITVIDCEPVFANFAFDNNLCVGDCITLNNLSEGPVATYEWTFGGAVDPDESSEASPTVCFTTVGTFTISLTVTSESGLTSSISTTMTVNEIPNITVQNDTIIDVGGEATLIVVAPSTGTYTWIPEDGLSCPDCEITEASPQNTTTYQVYYIDENGCSDQDSVKVWVNFAHGIGVPSGFSPNGDGVNDILFVKGFGIEALSFNIYNRYGELVFQSDNQNLGWDGTFKNRDENPGVFTWVLSYSMQDGSFGTLKGNTTLVR